MSSKAKLLRKPPSAANELEQLADWIELEALLSADGNSSVADLVKVLRRSGVVEGIESSEGEEGKDKGSEHSQQLANDAFAELSLREVASGGNYPFEIHASSLRIRKKALSSPYVFLLMLSQNGRLPGKPGQQPTVLFEEICARAAEGYLGGTANRARAIRFGAPKPTPNGSLARAIDWLCKEVGEGGGSKNAESLKGNNGDEHLDIVAWRDFHDQCSSKLIAFGQCATGLTNANSKLSELDATKFLKKWVRDPFLVDPIRLFFVPWRIPRSRRAVNAIDAGVLFDRCRIAACATSRAPKLPYAEWATKMLRAFAAGERRNKSAALRAA